MTLTNHIKQCSNDSDTNPEHTSELHLEGAQEGTMYENGFNIETVVQMSEGINPKEYTDIAINGTKNGVLKGEIIPGVAEDAANLNCQTFQPSPDFLFKVKSLLNASSCLFLIDVFSYSK